MRLRCNLNTYSIHTQAIISNYNVSLFKILYIICKFIDLYHGLQVHLLQIVYKSMSIIFCSKCQAIKTQSSVLGMIEIHMELHCMDLLVNVRCHKTLHCSNQCVFNAFLHSSIFNEKKNQLVIWRDYHNAENYHGLVFVLLSWLCKIVTLNEKQLHSYYTQWKLAT